FSLQEVLYLWHGFPVLAKAPHLLRMYLYMIESNISKVNKVKAPDDYYMLTLLRGVVLKYLDCPLQAEEYFKEVVQSEKEIKEDTFLPPYAAGELGIMFTEQMRDSEATEWLRIARHSYHGYLTEVMLHFRLHAAQKKLQVRNNLDLRETLTPSPHLSPPSGCSSGVSTPENLEFSPSELEPPLVTSSKTLLVPPNSLKPVFKR
ncbi:tetratricopeptide repeat protein 39B-like, partial [Limulus polyphemus]|uniref:Tetratricopeptide repeat protein 39B-like n=1 Tax=Limulus polyphemus TaxID=6850 RepID=A0ABM1RVU9_LIMPO